MAKISIIIPCYNAHDYICKCLEGLQRQTYTDFDIILVNDCSKDATVEVITDWISTHDLPATLISNEKNSGPSLSRFNGAMVSKSEWVAFCDSDDWYEDNFLELMLDKAERDECDVVFCGYQNVIGSKIDKHQLSDTELTLSPKEALLQNVDSLCMTLIKREIYVETPQPDLRNGEDMALVPLLIQSAKKVGVLDKVLYNYYIHPGSASLTPSDKMIDSLIKSYGHIKTHLSDQYKEEKEYLGIRNLIYGALLNLFKFSYNTGRAEEILDDFEMSFPSWVNNQYINRLPLFKKVYVKCACHRQYFIIYAMSRLHSFMLK